MKRKTTEEYISDCHKVHNNFYIYNKTVYINNKKEVIITCPIHGDFSLRADHHLYGQKCIECNKDNLFETFKIKANKKFNNFFEYTGPYNNNKTETKIICPVHGEFEQTPEIHLHSKFSCPICYDEQRKMTKEEFLKRCKEVHDINNYEYFLDDFDGVRIHILIKCKKHDYIFPQTPKNHLNGQGCPLCGIESRRITKEEFLERCKEIHGDLYKYEKVEFVDLNIPILIKCKKHGYFEQIPDYHIKGSGCPRCKDSRSERKISKFLKENNIDFKREYRFKDCRNILPLPFDFYLPKYNICIEFDGKHHYEINEIYGEHAFLGTKNRDLIKDKYCEENNIILFRIKYNENLEEKMKEILNFIFK